ncbi:MAG TPA: DUF928 domain-containing protein [Leptolyngbyaceae cyanobacterium M33_DOE_097]|nr:DUF928 domain-containing protein [Leptolyngbyaceae cyanobacterium M33_DOE_097]
MLKKPSNLLFRGLSLGLVLAIATTPLIAFAGFKPPKRGVPGRREGGGTRDRCLVAASGSPRSPIALVPDFKEAGKVGAGQTLSAHPRFFWYLPGTRTGTVEFTLYSGETEAPEAVLYQSRFQLARAAGQPSKPGIYSLALPADANVPSLEVGKVYRWSVEVLCPGVKPGSLKVEGGVERVAADAALDKSLTNANPTQRTTLYSENGLWFDAITTLADQSCVEPEATRKAWKTLMSDTNVNLSKVADVPIMKNCQ